jgi:hypothetical protein
MIEHGTNKVRLFPVQRRNADTLLPIIAENIALGSTIISNGWDAYGGIRLMQQQFNHRYNLHLSLY